MDVRLFLKLTLCLPMLSGIALPAQPPAASPIGSETRPDFARRDVVVPHGGEAEKRALAALAEAQKAVGGLRRLQEIHDVTRVVEMNNLAASGRVQATFQIVFPNVIRLTTDSPLGEITAFSDSKTGWTSSALGTDDKLPDWQLRASRLDLFRQLESLLQSDRDPDRKVEFVERGQVSGRPANVLQISSTAVGTIRLWIDVTSGDVVELEYRRIVTRGTGPIVNDFFHDYRWVGRTLRVPFYIHTLSDGQSYMDTRVIRAEYNRGLQTGTLSQKPPPKQH
jgi:hypothetical protein